MSAILPTPEQTSHISDWIVGSGLIIFLICALGYFINQWQISQIRAKNDAENREHQAKLQAQLQAESAIAEKVNLIHAHKDEMEEIQISLKRTETKVDNLKTMLTERTVLHREAITGIKTLHIHATSAPTVKSTIILATTHPILQSNQVASDSGVFDQEELIDKD
jgi:hypothetical protein